ncbi:MAG: general secretion pathway protein GspB [Desulfovibrionaceae bacterium]|nr:general secretion pathway protein GspB [Desulfovibrionaceae bacterium]
MHPYRRQIVWRWIAALGVVIAALSWVGTDTGTTLLRETPNRPVKRKELPLPSPQEMASLQSTVTALRRDTQRRAPHPEIRPVRGLLVDKLATQPQAAATPGEQPSRAVVLSLIMVGPGGRFAVLNGVAYEEGSLLADGRRVASIEPDGVVLEIEGQEERIPWSPLHSVSLFKPGTAKKEEPQQQEKPAEATRTAEQKAQDAAKLLGKTTSQ